MLHMAVSLFEIQSLRIAVRLQPAQPKFEANPTLFVPTKRRASVQLKVCIDPDASRFNLFREPGRSVEVTAPNRRAETVDGIVRLGNSFLVGLEAEQRHNWTWP